MYQAMSLIVACFSQFWDMLGKHTKGSRGHGRLVVNAAWMEEIEVEKHHSWAFVFNNLQFTN